MDIDFHNASVVTSETYHFDASDEHGAFDRLRITVKGIYGETLTINLFMADGAVPEIKAA